MQIYIPERPHELLHKIETRLKRRRIDSDQSLVRLSAELRKSILGDADRPVIVTGHQPIFYHPGILIKDLLAHALAKAVNGIALNLIVDTDEGEIRLALPVATSGRFLTKEEYVVSSRGQVLRGQKLNPERKESILKRINEYEKELYAIFQPAEVGRIRKGLSFLHDAVSGAKTVCEPGVRMREGWEKENGIELKTIYTGDIIQSEAFSYFKELIISRADDFRRIYNQALENYRTIHKLKNLAQPLPDLHPGELPFWYVENNNRIPFTEQYDIHSKHVYPRAVALTLFCRLFLADLMVHGIGGGRYDQITDQILEKYFNRTAAPFTIASSTLHLDIRCDYPIDSRTRDTIQQEIRSLTFDPTRFLSPQHELALRKKELIDRLVSVPGGMKKEIHEQIIALNEEVYPLIDSSRLLLSAELNRANLVAANRRICDERTFPFIFYNLNPIHRAVREYESVTLPSREDTRILTA